MPFLTLPRIIGDFAAYLKTKYELQSEPERQRQRQRAGSKSPTTVPVPTQAQSQTWSQTQSGTSLAPGWYVVCTRRELARLAKTKTPKDIQLFGQPFTLFCGEGEKTGRPYLVSRFCPHQGASLTRGKVVGDSIRCEFHHWQFAGADGACTLIPTSGVSTSTSTPLQQGQAAALNSIPRKARLSSLPLIERNGVLFTWYGGSDHESSCEGYATNNSSVRQSQSQSQAHSQTQPDYELPVLVTNPESYYRLDFTFHTRATPRRILENLWDADHIPKLHGLPVKNGISLEIFASDAFASASEQDRGREREREREQAFGNRKLLVSRENWFAIRARAELKAYIGLSGRLVKLLGVKFNHFDLTVEACPTLGVATIEIDGNEKSRNILAVTPITDGYSLSRLVIYVKKTGSLRADLVNLLLFGLQNYLGGLQDVLVWNHLRDLSNAEAVATSADKPFYLFRRFYARASVSASASASAHQPNSEVN